MSSSFESMVNEMGRWNTKPEVVEKTSESEVPNAILDEDEIDPADEIGVSPASGRAASTGETKGTSRLDWKPAKN